jgi:hypothetical protein
MTEEQDMSEPTIDELHRAFDDLVGDPRPTADLASRARSRGTTLRRQRMAGGLTAVAVAGALALPALAFVRDQAQGGTAGAAFAGQPKASETASIDKLTSGTGVGPTDQTLIRPGVLTALDHSRVDAAKAVLGNGFTLTSTDIAVDKASGAHVGAAATFTATTGGGIVAVEWSTIERANTGKTSSKAGPTSGPVGAKDGQGRVSGAVLVVGNTEWDAKILQGSPGSTPILATKTAAMTFLSRLAAASS